MATDRRVKYTKMVLRDSFIHFLSQKPISRITIKEICAYADINRATYYAHYRDQFDQLKQIEEAFLNDINAYLDTFTPDTGDAGLLSMVEKIFEYIQQNAQLCLVLLGPNGDIDFQANVMQFVSGRILQLWAADQHLDRITAEYALTFLASGCIGVIQRWLLEPHGTSAHEIAAFVVRLANHGMEDLLHA